MKIVCSQEEEPLGTAGPIKLAKDLLLGGVNIEGLDSGLSKDEYPYFFVFNSDVVCEYPLQEMLECHRSHGKEATMLTT